MVLPVRAGTGRATPAPAYGSRSNAASTRASGG